MQSDVGQTGRILPGEEGDGRDEGNVNYCLAYILDYTGFVIT